MFVRTPQLVTRARAAIAGLAGAAEMTTAPLSLAKGLEFRAVVVMACDEGILPLDERVADAADEAELDDIYETERRLLYVACTRAREHLLLTGVASIRILERFRRRRATTLGKLNVLLRNDDFCLPPAYRTASTRARLEEISRKLLKSLARPKRIRTPDPQIRSLALRNDLKAAYADENESLTEQSRPGRRGKNLIAGAGPSASFAPLVARR